MNDKPDSMSLDDVIANFRGKKFKREPTSEKQVHNEVYEWCAWYLETHRTALEAGMQKPLRFKQVETIGGGSIWQIVDPDGEFVLIFDGVIFYTKHDCKTFAHHMKMTAEFVEADDAEN